MKWLIMEVGGVPSRTGCMLTAIRNECLIDIINPWSSDLRINFFMISKTERNVKIMRNYINTHLHNARTERGSFY